MDFDEFRKKKLEKKQEEKAADESGRLAASGKELGWIDGLGPAGGPRNPKVKGFVLGRFQRKRIDPSTLERPKGYESTALGAGGEDDPAKKTPAEIELERRKAALAKAEADLAAVEEQRKQQEIEARRQKEGFERIKGFKKY